MTWKSLESAIERKGFSRQSLFQRIIYTAGLVVTGVGLCGSVASLRVYAQESRTGAPAGPKPFNLPSDDILQKYMRIPIHELLKDFVVPVNDNNYQNEVFGADRPVLVVFTACPNALANGLGALVKVLHENYPGIKVCHYDLGKDVQVSREEVFAALSRISKKYPIKNLPYLVFYRFRQGVVTEMPGDYNFMGGISHIDKLKYWIREYGDMPKGLW